MQDLRWNLENWYSELKRLEIQYKKLDNKASTEAIGIMDQIDAVRQIIREMEDSGTKKKS